MKTETKIGLAFFIILILGLILYIKITTTINRNNNLSYVIKGVVQNVSYDVKEIPIIIVNEKKITLSAGYDFNKQIEKGDTLKKEKGSPVYILIKKATGHVFKFDNSGY